MDFDTLLSSLSSAVSQAQRSLSRRHQGQLRRLYTDDKGTSLTWTFYIATDEDDNHYRPVELPLISLRSNQELNISELSIELNCSLETAAAGDLRRRREATLPTEKAVPETNPQRSGRPLMLVLRNAKQAFDKHLARIKILLYANGSQGRALINNREFKRFEMDNDS
jgi:hypothetical protein